MVASAVSSNSSEVGFHEGKRSSSLPNRDLTANVVCVQYASCIKHREGLVQLINSS